MSIFVLTHNYVRSSALTILGSPSGSGNAQFGSPRDFIPLSYNDDVEQEISGEGARHRSISKQETGIQSSSYSWDAKDEKEGEEEEEECSGKPSIHEHSLKSQPLPVPQFNSSSPSSSSCSQLNCMSPSYHNAPIAKKVLQAVWTENLEFQTDRSLFNRYVEGGKEEG